MFFSDLLAYLVTSIDADVWDADVVLSAPRLRKSRKKVAAAITTSATASSAISLLYLHIINIPMHVICRASTYDDGRRWTTRRPLSHSYAVRLTYDVVRCVNGP